MRFSRNLYRFSILLTSLLLAGCGSDDEPGASADDIHFPNSQTWESITMEDLGWQRTALSPLLEFLENTNTEAFILLKNGRIVIEEYFGETEASDNLPWFSAGKTLTAVLAGNGVKEGFFDENQTTNHYLGPGWSSLREEDEAEIRVRHHLSMTTGLNDRVNDPFCTGPPCLFKLEIPGARWAYHNAPYTLVTNMLETSGTDLNEQTRNLIGSTIGMNGSWVNIGFNRIYFSTPRSMARFGLLLLAETEWNGNPAMVAPGYFERMTTSSQALNPAYGYLTWLNGQSSFKIPGIQADFPGMIAPSAPADMYAAMGRDGQLINVVPSEGLVMIRMGDAPNNDLVPFSYQEDLWAHLSRLFQP